MLEGTAYEIRRRLEQIAPDVPLARIRSVGGGTKNRAWTQIMSDVLCAEQHCYPETAGAPYGDAYLAGLGTGLFDDFRPLVETWIRGGYAVRPQADHRAAYEQMYRLYRDVVERMEVDRDR
jgi:xylulokinase